MTLQAACTRYDLVFNEPAGTSRGVLLEKPSIFIAVWDSDKPSEFGLGECGHIPGLSIEPLPELQTKTEEVCAGIARYWDNPAERLRDWPSLVFALEAAKAELRHGRGFVAPSAFTQGEKSIPINGLIWMGGKEKMLRQIEAKLNDGWKCIKLKIGGLDFNEELDLLKHIRAQFGAEELEIRLDANGAFSPGEAREKMKRLAEFQPHSIEQPVAPGQIQLMSGLCASGTVPVALDEELIGVRTAAERRELVALIRPQYLVLKPGLHGGFCVCEDWIKIIKELGGGFWITSALESNVGLNAIAQWAWGVGGDCHQGLGTGQIYNNNFDSPLEVASGGRLHFNPQRAWDLTKLDEAFGGKFSLQANVKVRPDYIYLKHGTAGSPEMLKAMEEISNKPDAADWQKSFAEAASKWAAEGDSFEMTTSGSTGAPKSIKIKKAHALLSARKTLGKLGINSPETLLLCMPSKFIGGLMVYVRAVAGNHALCVVSPETRTWSKLEGRYALASLTPHQLKKNPSIMEHCSAVLLGGEQADAETSEIASRYPDVGAYETFGMTETISHFALRRLGTAKDEPFELLEGIELDIREDGTAFVSIAEMGIDRLPISDLLRSKGPGQFIWLGRKDNVINSGGIKIIPEELEHKLRPFIKYSFIVGAAPDKRFGQSVALIIEDRNGEVEEDEVKNWIASAGEKLGKYEKPKYWGAAQSFPRTETGKIRRQQTLELPICYQPL